MYKKNLYAGLSTSLLLTLCLSGCVSYQALSLPTATNYHDLTVDRGLLNPFPALKAYPFNPELGLDALNITMLAVSNNPALQLARKDMGVAEAQVYSAGLLPDPQLSLAHDIRVAAGSQAASSIGLSYDFIALLTHSLAKKQAKESLHQSELNLLWQEWQVVGQAQLLMTRLQMQQKTLSVQLQNQAIAKDRVNRMMKAMQTAGVTRDQVNADVVALQAINSRIDDLKTAQQVARHDLNALLGLAANTQLNLKFNDQDMAQRPKVVDAQLIRVALDHINTHRPDLLALRAGYSSEDAKLRQAIWSQFPSLNIGLTQAKDSSGVSSQSLGISLNLPVFNGNRGNIAVEKATRQRMYEEYQSRLNQTVFEVQRLQAEQQQNVAIWHERYLRLKQLQQDVEKATPAHTQRLIDDQIWLTLQNNMLNQKLDLLNLEQTIREQAVGLNTLLGLPVLQSAGVTP
ncbi:TolC family protein [Acinetobacter sp. 161(2023)]|uniref:TolC family protein n=1 Tax=Acinetobacter sp. 161(2023) TaxID=3098768 RepID=UPI00300B9B49